LVSEEALVGFAVHLQRTDYKSRALSRGEVASELVVTCSLI